jgi:PKD repeat protein
MWRTDGSTKQLTFTDYDAGENGLAIGGPDGSDFIVFDNGSGRRPGLYYIDRGAADKEGLIDPEAWTNGYLRMDGYRAVWWDGSKQGVFWTVFKTADISLSARNLHFSNDSPIEGETIALSIVVRNDTDYEATGDIVVVLTAGDPRDDSSEILGEQIIAGGLGPREKAEVRFDGILAPPVTDGSNQSYEFCISVTRESEAYDLPCNNVACRALDVQDDDVVGPTIVSLEVAEYGGDGDGIIRSNEQVRVSWSASDSSGVASTEVVVDNHEPVPASQLDNDDYEVVLGPLAAGRHRLVVRATDGDRTAATSEVERELVVKLQALPPKAVAGPGNGIRGPAPVVATFEHHESYDPNDPPSPLHFEWSFGDGSVVVATDDLRTAIQHTYLTPGSYTATLNVTNALGLSDDATVAVRVDASPNKPPVAAFQVDRVSGEVPLTVSFDGSKSYDPEGEVLTFSWGFDDGSPVDGRGPAVTHTYSRQGTYTATLTVTDSLGLSGQTSAVITVSAPEPSDETRTGGTDGGSTDGDSTNGTGAGDSGGSDSEHETTEVEQNGGADTADQNACGAGACGAGFAPTLPLTLLTLAGLKRRGRR